jgi:hypothetical protein
MRELSVAEQRYQAVLAVIGEGETVTDVAAGFGVSVLAGMVSCPVGGWGEDPVVLSCGMACRIALEWPGRSICGITEM